MAARTIVTFHPDVACDVCGRRLLRGERPDVFLGGGQRRMVCELCTPRATHEGWRREVEEQLASPRTQGPQRGRSLLGRLRQLREPARAADPQSTGATPPGLDLRAPTEGDTAGAEAWTTGIDDREWSDIDEEWAGITAEHAVTERPTGAAGDVGTTGELAGTPAPAEIQSSTRGRGAADADVRRALELFNAGEELPRRVAGVARALGAASVRAAPVAGTSGKVSIVVAWELCWYRYEIDLNDEAAGVRIAAEGMELEELAAEDRIANVTADERGELALLAG
jgi:hypothetical protein